MLILALMKVSAISLVLMVHQALANMEPSSNDTRELTTTCTNNFICPAFSYRIPNRECYDRFNDCACYAGYYKKLDKCVVRPPKNAPVKPPTNVPLKPPTRGPVKPPTRAPIKPPTRYPVRPSTRHPVKPPTRAPVNSNGCALPPKTLDFSIITWGDCTIAGHSMYKGVGIGGALYDGSPDEYGTIDRTISYVRYLNPNNKFHFNGGLKVGETVPQSMYDQLNYVANNAVSAKYHDGYEVFVLTRGGTYDLYDFIYEGQGENNGKTLVIFRTHEDIILTSANGRQFGPSVLAPFSKVIVMGDAGYVDGFVIGNSVHTSGNNANGLQFHGDGYTGPLTCH